MSKKKDKKNGGKGKNVLERYNNAKAEKNVGVTAMKSGVDMLIGTTAGGIIGAFAGRYSPIAGIILFGVGHYFGEKSGILRVAGAAATAYGVAKAIENWKSGEDDSVDGFTLAGAAKGAKERLIDFKDNWLKAFYLDKLISKKEESTDSDESEATIGAIDLSALDVFEDMNKQSAVQFELQRIKKEDENSLEEPLDDEFEEEDTYEEDFIDDDLDGLSYALIEEEVDFSTL